jgi:hypothetical protein
MWLLACYIILPGGGTWPTLPAIHATLQGRLEIAGAMMVAMLFLQQGVMKFLPAAILTPPAIVIVGGYFFIWLLGAPLVQNPKVRRRSI